MTFYALATPDGGDARLLLGPLGTLPATIPSVFGGNGGEPRKAIRFAVRDERTLNAMQPLEQTARDLLARVVPKIVWNSAIAEATELYPASIKAQN